MLRRNQRRMMVGKATAFALRSLAHHQSPALSDSAVEGRVIQKVHPAPVDSPEREIPTPSRSVRNSAIFTIRSSIPASSATIRSMTHPSGAVRPPVERAKWITHAFPWFEPSSVPFCLCSLGVVAWCLGALVPRCPGAFAHPHAVVARAPQTDPAKLSVSTLFGFSRGCRAET
jgi:hypothetical protein